MSRLFFCICMLGLFSFVQGQTRFGLTLGYNLYKNQGKELSTLGAAYGLTAYGVDWKYTRTNTSPELRSGFQAGIALNFRSSKVIQVHTGLLYELISGANKYVYSRYDYPYNPFNKYQEYDETNRLGYLTIPLLLSFTKKAGPGKLSVLLGPQFSFATGGSYDAVVRTYYNASGSPGYTLTVTTEERGKYKVSDKFDLEKGLDEYRRSYRLFHMAIQTGLGYEYKNIMLKAYYTIGITNTEPTYINSNYKYSVFYSGFNVSATWFFQLKNKR